jgi:hypothetical protein
VNLQHHARFWVVDTKCFLQKMFFSRINEVSTD